LFVYALLDYLTVSETAKEPPQFEEGEFNSPQKLSLEATYINQNMSQQMLQVSKLCLHMTLYLTCCRMSSSSYLPP